MTTVFTQEPAFSGEEYAKRLGRVRAAMDAAALDILIVHDLSNICYLTGFQTPLSDWYHCAIVPRSGDVVLHVCDHELAAVNTQVARIEPVLWERMDEAGGQLVGLLQELGAERRRLGFEPRRTGLRPHVYDEVRRALPHAECIDASDLVARLRVVKSHAEIACMRRAAEITVAGMSAGIAAIGATATDNDVTAAASAAMLRAGSEYFNIDPIVRVGARASIIHATCKRFPIAPGETVFMEFGGVYQRYCAPLIRTAIRGEPSDEVARMADISLRTLALLFENVRPGRTLDDIARTMSTRAPGLEGAAKTRGYFGYSVGIGFPPVWVEHSLGIVEGANDVVQAGMTFHCHRSIRVPGRLGVAFSETILVTETGCEALTEHPRELAVV